MDNLEVVRGSWEALERGGVDAAEEYWHPDIDWRAAEGAIDDVGVIRGRDAMRRYYGDWMETLDEVRTEIEKVVLDEGERLVVVLRGTGRGRVSGAPGDGRYAVVYTIRDGLIVRGREYGSAEQALAALGRRERA